MGVVRGPNGTTHSGCMLDYSRKTRKISREAQNKLAHQEAIRDLRSGRAGEVKVSKFSRQISLPQTTGRDCHGSFDPGNFGPGTQTFAGINGPSLENWFG